MSVPPGTKSNTKPPEGPWTSSSRERVKFQKHSSLSANAPREHQPLPPSPLPRIHTPFRVNPDTRKPEKRRRTRHTGCWTVLSRQSGVQHPRHRGHRRERRGLVTWQQGQKPPKVTAVLLYKCPWKPCLLPDRHHTGTLCV